MLCLTNCASIRDLARRARRRIPRSVWTYFDSGAGENAGVVRNEDAFKSILFCGKRFGGPVTSTNVNLFGENYSQPFGVAPVGLCNFVWPCADRALAELAITKNIPLAVSTFASSSIEQTAERTKGKFWFQTYLFREHALTEALMQRAWDAGVRVLVFTIDAAHDRRHNDVIRYDHANRYVRRIQRIIDALLHPCWLVQTLLNGVPQSGNAAKYDGAFKSNFLTGEHDDRLSWKDFTRIRELWKGKLVVKGVLDPEDAQRLVKDGADGIWISTHGGRQLESFPAPIMVLPAIRAAIGPSLPIMIDSGIRSGEDIAKALALGANFVFLGRPFLYGAGAAGAKGVNHAYDILATELRMTLAQIGCPSVSSLDESYLCK